MFLIILIFCQHYFYYYYFTYFTCKGLTKQNQNTSWLGIICDANSSVVTQYYKTGSELLAFAFSQLSFTLSQGALC